MSRGILSAFLSSTGEDLYNHRTLVFSTIHGLDGWTCVRMEDFGARSEAPLNFCRAKIAECDLFIGLLGIYYGSSPPPPNDNMSFTEHEYEYAKNLGKGRLMFVASDRLRIPSALNQSSQQKQRQETFRRRVLAEDVASFFEDPEPLASQVARSIYNWTGRVKAQTGVEIICKAFLQRYGVTLPHCRIDSGEEIMLNWNKPIFIYIEPERRHTIEVYVKATRLTAGLSGRALKFEIKEKPVFVATKEISLRSGEIERYQYTVPNFAYPFTRVHLVRL